MWVVSGWVVSRNYNVITIRAYNFVEFCGLDWVGSVNLWDWVKENGTMTKSGQSPINNSED